MWSRCKAGICGIPFHPFSVKHIFPTHSNRKIRWHVHSSEVQCESLQESDLLSSLLQLDLLRFHHPFPTCGFPDFATLVAGIDLVKWLDLAFATLVNGLFQKR
ncbi:hypothetical protein AVEN_95307-1 [Araneus ventricosus]|uniref:Uncharacterized protein n=1 Tax=Araneus ventricosus TaxID=182803 RepID=A0A4Y2N4A2_ARAVE|nr:hypothetical protein AVEN_95307-1 [Araneus ventricosus]